MPDNMEIKQKLSKQPGLVISYFGNSVAVEAEDGQVFQCQLHRNQELPVVGDRVLWQMQQSNNCTIEEILPRKSLMARGGFKGKMKALAANIDAILIVMAPPPIFSEKLIDRYLMAAELLDIQPVIVVNKNDLLTDSARAELRQRLAPYETVPYVTILTSAINSYGLAELQQFLKNKAAVLIGPSGVGKSSIIAALNCDERIRIGEVSPKGSGKHTTTATRLYHLADNAILIDSPGVRDFTLWPVTKEEVLASFKEFKTFIADCKFRDCQHLAEPHCGVKQAVAAGNISAQRYKNYQTLMQAARDAK